MARAALSPATYPTRKGLLERRFSPFARRLKPWRNAGTSETFSGVGGVRPGDVIADAALSLAQGFGAGLGRGFRGCSIS